MAILIIIFIIIGVIIAGAIENSRKEKAASLEALRQRRLAEIEFENERNDKLRIIDEMTKSLGMHISKYYPHIHDNKTASAFAQQCKKISSESTKLIYSTVKPDVFFKRYEILVENKYALIQCEEYTGFCSINSYDKLIELLSKRNKEANDFISRSVLDLEIKIGNLKTLKAKENNIDKFFDEMNKYEKCFSDENMEHLKTSEIKLRDNIKREKEMVDFDKITEKFEKEMAKFEKEMEEYDKITADGEEEAEFDKSITEINEIKMKNPVQKTIQFESNSIEGMSQFEKLPFNFQSPLYREVGQEKFYLFTDDNKYIAKQHILSLNAFLEDAVNLVPQMPAHKITTVSFVPDGEDYINYTFFKCVPYTNAGKVSKYPMEVHFRTNKFGIDSAKDNIFGEIYYMANGEMGKAKIVCWKNKKNHVIECAIKDDELTISKIYSNDSTGKSILYTASQRVRSE